MNSDAFIPPPAVTIRQGGTPLPATSGSERNTPALKPPDAEPPAGEQFKNPGAIDARATTEAGRPENGDPGESLSAIRRGAAFSSVLPKLQDAFGQMEQPGSSVLDTLSGNIIQLQDSFLETLYKALKELGADLSEKLTIRLNDEANLEVGKDHPDTRRINAALAENPELAAALAEIAAQSAALRDLQSLRIMLMYGDPAVSYAVLCGYPGENAYQISLKGEMNHFYFTR